MYFGCRQEIEILRRLEKRDEDDNLSLSMLCGQNKGGQIINSL